MEAAQVLSPILLLCFCFFVLLRFVARILLVQNHLWWHSFKWLPSFRRNEAMNAWRLTKIPSYHRDILHPKTLFKMPEMKEVIYSKIAVFVKNVQIRSKKGIIQSYYPFIRIPQICYFFLIWKFSVKILTFQKNLYFGRKKGVLKKYHHFRRILDHICSIMLQKFLR